ncbi:DUF4397 domain-containing protein [Pedobacter sp.]|uniref:DUF4397 domain-containing protein n=1 Tax=Pedobacter sp. TaxID=1411316 RepID=UPI00396CF5EE
MRTLSGLKLFISAIVIGLSLTSCLKNKNSDYQPVQISGLSLINAVPSSTNLDVYVDNLKATNFSIDFSFGTKIDYLNAYSGKRKLDLTKQGVQTSLASTTITLDPQIAYSLFAVNKIETPEFLLLKDDLTAPQSGKAKVRFVNLSPDLGIASIAINGSNTNLFSNMSFKQASDYTEITAGTSVTFDLKNSNGTVETQLSQAQIEAGKIYTIYAKGLKSASDNTQLSMSIFRQK